MSQRLAAFGVLLLIVGLLIGLLVLVVAVGVARHLRRHRPPDGLRRPSRSRRQSDDEGDEPADFPQRPRNPQDSDD